MNKILLGVLVGAAVAGVAYYLYDSDKAEAQLGNLKNKANEALDNAKAYLSKKTEETEASVNA